MSNQEYKDNFEDYLEEYASIFFDPNDDGNAISDLINTVTKIIENKNFKLGTKYARIIRKLAKSLPVKKYDQFVQEEFINLFKNEIFHEDSQYASAVSRAIEYMYINIPPTIEYLEEADFIQHIIYNINNRLENVLHLTSFLGIMLRKTSTNPLLEYFYNNFDFEHYADVLANHRDTMIVNKGVFRFFKYIAMGKMLKTQENIYKVFKFLKRMIKHTTDNKVQCRSIKTLTFCIKNWNSEAFYTMMDFNLIFFLDPITATHNYAANLVYDLYKHLLTVYPKKITPNYCQAVFDISNGPTIQSCSAASFLDTYTDLRDDIVACLWEGRHFYEFYNSALSSTYNTRYHSSMIVLNMIKRCTTFGVKKVTKCGEIMSIVRFVAESETEKGVYAIIDAITHLLDVAKQEPEFYQTIKIYFENEFGGSEFYELIYPFVHDDAYSKKLEELYKNHMTETDT
ncbi:hypothetical protein TVAG_413400 [Trichomonas vaginalis G3]|uniref:Uncharacterized protein n=1 Tax=Trichomonas vaginalis (strain ATCC PRA-98 / G3) TaxID=412133 RepID=A2F9H2_TRIV3|nr:armadillo (ARM) repeat-containing protein family [Trichomonas vaginalis G3]EAX98443.1 hypothetical protein TVAG_413400 [Trichomonas vaginalis G3]KAI5493723.1 armadillo (ARM) repeat-containing protein family [Trichomonas vaginalis G3]|eukprot:XP_001311373.1 hypothetical protein [Trichomonas vaginalis G3]